MKKELSHHRVIWEEGKKAGIEEERKRIIEILNNFNFEDRIIVKDIDTETNKEMDFRLKKELISQINSPILFTDKRQGCLNVTNIPASLKSWRKK